ncbi:MAG: hypothetical protein JST59_05840 [Actinobacteria bacterium]|nr:hypothetical protein [Actinomycetota bacterium]
MKDLIVFCADIGSVSGNRFGWARVDPDERRRSQNGKGIDDLVSAVAGDLGRRPVALGFECPLWLPYPLQSKDLGRARPGEGRHPWSAGAGAAVLATGLVQLPWIVEGLRRHAPGASCHLDWARFDEAGAGLFLWEAFISGAGKTGPGISGSLDVDVRDATIAATEFARRSRLGTMTTDLPAPEAGAAISVLGLALAASGWCEDPAVLRRDCLVLKVDGQG